MAAGPALVVTVEANGVGMFKKRRGDALHVPGMFESPRPRRRMDHPLARGSVALVLVAGLVWGVMSLYPNVRCGGFALDGLFEVGGECVGANDGGYVFSEKFRDIQEDIKAENDRVAARHAEGEPAVKIAFMSTLTPTGESPLDPKQIRNALEGAYVAQYRANHTTWFGDRTPLVQLYLVNEGSVQQGWESAVDQVLQMRDDDIPLSIVTGQSIGTVRTTEGAKRFEAAGVPVVTATVTADQLDHDQVPGLIRAAPSNTDLSRALRRHLDAQDELESGILVFDSNPDDTFSATLRSSFEKHLDDYIEPPGQPYPGGSIEQDKPEVFGTITQNICTADTDMVMFAGRAPDLEPFVDALSDRVCQDKPLTILFTDVGLYTREGVPQIERQLEDARLTLLHANSYDPAWFRDAGEVPEGFAEFKSYFEKLIDGDERELDNGYSVNNHDAVGSAARAVRLAADLTDSVPDPENVRDNILLLNGQNTVRGATGTLSFNVDRAGNPGGKHVPIVPLPYPDDAEARSPYITPES